MQSDIPHGETPPKVARGQVERVHIPSIARLVCDHALVSASSARESFSNAPAVSLFSKSRCNALRTASLLHVHWTVLSPHCRFV